MTEFEGRVLAERYLSISVESRELREVLKLTKSLAPPAHAQFCGYPEIVQRLALRARAEHHPDAAENGPFQLISWWFRGFHGCPRPINSWSAARVIGHLAWTTGSEPISLFRTWARGLPDHRRDTQNDLNFLAHSFERAYLYYLTFDTYFG